VSTPHVCRLYLEIDGTRYLTEAAVATYPVTAWRLTKDDSTSYVARLGVLGPFCTCPAATWHPETKCKHVSSLISTGLLPAVHEAKRTENDE
jgi:hypothetical protein